MTELIEISQENSKKFVPVREAAKRVSYTTDYVGRLAREGKIEAKRDGRAWLVELDSLKLFSLQAKADAIRKQEDLKLQRRIERATAQIAAAPIEEKIHNHNHRHLALLETAAITVCFSLVLLLVQVSFGSGFGVKDWQRGLSVVTEETQSALAFEAFTNFELPSWLWFVRYEKREVLVKEDGLANSPVVLEGSETHNLQLPAQIDLTEGNLLIVSDETKAEENAKYIGDTFSDDVLVEFADSRNGTVTAEFISAEPESYPFRLVKAPIKPNTD